MSTRGGQAGPSRPPALEEWQSDYARAIPELSSLARKAKEPFSIMISRANQMDAGRLDVELTNMLLEQFLKAFSLIEPRYLNAFRPEMSMILDFLIFRFSVWKGKPTPGSVLMNLRYRDESCPSKGAKNPGQSPWMKKLVQEPVSCAPYCGYVGISPIFTNEYEQIPCQPVVGGSTGVEGPDLSLRQRLGWGLGFVFSKYVWERLDSVAVAWRWGDQQEGSAGYRSWRAMQWVESAYKLASLANFITFLRFGRYRTLLERILRSRLVYKRASMPKALNFEYLNRQLIWHELSELLLFLLPLIDVARLKAFVMKSVLLVYQPAASQGRGRDMITKSIRQCNICLKQEMNIPYTAQPCQHLFCYYCLRSSTENEAGYKCPVCDTTIQSMERWRPDLTADAPCS